jgi:hypothetical protein
VHRFNSCRGHLDPATGDAVDCTLQLVGFTTQNGTLQALLRLTNEVTGQTQILADLPQ